MATDGHPHLTKALDEQRSRQRAVLRCAPEDYLHVVVQDYDPSPSDVPQRDRPLIEAGLRDLADAVLDEFAEMAEHWQRYAVAAETRAFLVRHARPPRFQDDEFERAKDGSKAEMSATTERVNNPSLKDKEAGRVLVMLLIWADAMAGGDYRDPRLGEDPPAVG